jgi:RNA polymerase sigma-70 factor (ECF subfamily)
MDCPFLFSPNGVCRPQAGTRGSSIGMQQAGSEYFFVATDPNAVPVCTKQMPQTSSVVMTSPGHAPNGEIHLQAAETAAALRRCAEGDRVALRVLFDNEAGRMLAIARRILRRRDLAEEVVQEAFVRIWRKAGSYDSDLGSARSWIYAIVRNLALNALRDGRHEILVDEQMPEPGPAPQDVLGQLAESSALRRCLERLDDNRRNCLLLAYVGGFSHGEIAGRLGAPLGTVKAWIRRGLLSLRECLG